MVGVYYQMEPYLRAPERDDEFGVTKASSGTLPFPFQSAFNYGALAKIDPVKGVDSVQRDVTLDPGRRFTGLVLGPDGKPLTGTRSFDLIGNWWDHEAMATAEFTGWFSPRHQPHDILFQHLEKGLIGVAQSPTEKGGSVTVRLEPGAVVTGRVIDAHGQPRAGVELEVRFRPKGNRNSWWYHYSPERIQTDREGRFRLSALLPGYDFRLMGDLGDLHLGGPFRAGQTKDLGDVQLLKTAVD
jgi:hypothetical protein